MTIFYCIIIAAVAAILKVLVADENAIMFIPSFCIALSGSISFGLTALKFLPGLEIAYLIPSTFGAIIFLIICEIFKYYANR